MHALRWLGGVAAVFVLAAGARAQAPGYPDTIKLAEVEVRSGPSPMAYPTSKLRQGETVRVIKEEAGWLAIVPPEGSFDWINQRQVQLAMPSAIVTQDGVETLVGSKVVNKQPDKIGKKLSKGTQLVVVGQPFEPSPGLSYLPVQPPPDEYRYIPKDAVSGTAPVQASATAATPPFGVAPTSAGAATGPVLWQQAEQAERENRMVAAYALYQQLANETADQDLKIRCYNRMQYLRDGTRAPGATMAGTPGQPVDSRLTTAPAPARAYSQYGAPPQSAPSTGTGGIQPAGGPAAAPNAGAAQWIGPGKLVRASFSLANQQAYQLQSNDGKLLCYVTAVTGQTLEPYVDKTVWVQGPPMYHNQLRQNHVVAQQISLVK